MNYAGQIPHPNHVIRDQYESNTLTIRFNTQGIQTNMIDYKKAEIVKARAKAFARLLQWAKEKEAQEDKDSKKTS